MDEDTVLTFTLDTEGRVIATPGPAFINWHHGEKDPQWFQVPRAFMEQTARLYQAAMRL